jgi:hypothetical protein
MVVVGVVAWGFGRGVSWAQRPFVRKALAAV